MNEYIFTFGMNQTDKNGCSLGNCYAVILSDSENRAKFAMFDIRGSSWSFVYTSKESAGVERFNLKEVSLEDIRIR